MDTVVQVLQVGLKTLAVIFPAHPIHTRRRRFPQQAIGRLQQFDVDMMQQGGERLVVPFRCFPYAIEPVGQAFPAQRPALAVPNRVPLGPFPSLHRLLGRSPALVRRLPPVCAFGIRPARYYGRV